MDQNKTIKIIHKYVHPLIKLALSYDPIYKIDAAPVSRIQHLLKFYLLVILK